MEKKNPDGDDVNDFPFARNFAVYPEGTL